MRFDLINPITSTEVEAFQFGNLEGMTPSLRFTGSLLATKKLTVLPTTCRNKSTAQKILSYDSLSFTVFILLIISLFAGVAQRPMIEYRY